MIDNMVVHGDLYIVNSDQELTDIIPMEDIQAIRNNPLLVQLKKQVKKRDKVCQCCGEVPVNNHLEVHHIMPLSKYPDLACDEGNLISLCQKCHAEYHQLYEGCENAENFAKFMRDKK